jgi:hypothetical protein
VLAPQHLLQCLQLFKSTAVVMIQGVQIDVTRSLPCELCGLPTHVIAAEIFGCAVCSHRESQPRPDGMVVAQAMHCDACNP